MSKFIKAIAGTAEGIKLQRAKNTATSAKLAQESLINTLRSNVQNIEAALTQHLDIGPDSGDSLRPVGRNFDSVTWVNSVQDFKLKLKKANEQLDVAVETYHEWFVEETAEIATTS